MTNNPEASSVPPELAETLTEHPDGPALATLWEELGQLTPQPTSATTAGWLAVQQRIENRSQSHPVASTSAQPWARRLAVAAALILAAGIARLTTQTVSISAAGGDTRAVTLPDGSVVHLDGGARIRYTRDFRVLTGGRAAARRVALTGNAYFEVAKDGRPFVVQTFNASTEVLGTRFAVLAREGPHGATTVEVSEGRVALRGSGRAAAVVLGAGERSSVSRQAAEATPVAEATPDRIAAWRTGGFVIADERLDVALEDLARHSGARITLRNAGAADMHIALYYPKPTPVSVILRDICTSRGLAFRPVAGGYEVQ